MTPSLTSLFQITYSSISLPRRHKDIFTRYRLLSLLNGCLERKLVLVISPAGYGKTSLLVDFAHQKDVSACWYTVDQYDQDLRRFLAHFIAAISLVFSDFGTRSNTALARLDGTDDQLEAVVNAIVNEIFECIHKDFWILLDDFHVLADRPAINAFLNRMVCRAPENCHLVIASRRQPAFPGLELYKSRGQVGILGVGDLALYSGGSPGSVSNAKYPSHN